MSLVQDRSKFRALDPIRRVYLVRYSAVTGALHDPHWSSFAFASTEQPVGTGGGAVGYRLQQAPDRSDTHAARVAPVLDGAHRQTRRRSS